MWKELEAGDSQMGQLLLYMLGAHLRQLKKISKSGSEHSSQPVAVPLFNGELVWWCQGLGYFSYSMFINPWRACTARVTVLALSVCVCVCYTTTAATPHLYALNEVRTGLL